nr:hypothetical protein [Tahibacter aquaticus]
MVHTKCEAGGQQRFVRALGYQAADRLDFPWAGGAVIKHADFGSEPSGSDAPRGEHQMRVEVSTVAAGVGGMERDEYRAAVSGNKVLGNAVGECRPGGFGKFVGQGNDQVATDARVLPVLGSLCPIPDFFNVRGPRWSVRRHHH